MLVQHGVHDRRVRVTGASNTGFRGIAGIERAFVRRGPGSSTAVTGGAGTCALVVVTVGETTTPSADGFAHGSASQPATVAIRLVRRINAFHASYSPARRVARLRSVVI
jgi:hypothetical protein